MAALFLALAALTLLSDALGLDLSLAARFYRPGEGWFLAEEEPWRRLYLYGTLPGLFLMLGALGVFSLSLVSLRWTPFRRHALVALLTVVLGGGVLVNGLLKPYWGRPRPSQTVEFGGEWAYRPVFSPGTPGKGQSFPCGHCTMGYVFTALFFLRRRAPRLALAGGAFGLFYGTLVGAARVVQGAHYPTDVLWSLGTVALTAMALDAALVREGKSGAPHPRATRSAVLVFSVAAALVVAFFLTRRPFYETVQMDVDLPHAATTLRVRADADLSLARTLQARDGKVRILFTSQGFALPWSTFSASVTTAYPDGETLEYHIAPRWKGYFSEIENQVRVFVPEETGKRLRVEIPKTGARTGHKDSSMVKVAP
jgi:membrane-associated PAP2 superfamily phosphatase